MIQRTRAFLLVLVLTIAMTALSLLPSSGVAQAAPVLQQRSQPSLSALACSRQVWDTQIYNSRSGVAIGHIYLYYYAAPCSYWQGHLERYSTLPTGPDGLDLCDSSDSCVRGTGQGYTIDSPTLGGTGTYYLTGEIYASGSGNLLGQNTVSATSAQNCVAVNNLSEVADHFISRCRQAKIRRAFPTELLNRTLGSLRNGSSAREKSAWKLLSSNEYAK